MTEFKRQFQEVRFEFKLRVLKITQKPKKFIFVGSISEPKKP